MKIRRRPSALPLLLLLPSIASGLASAKADQDLLSPPAAVKANRYDPPSRVAPFDGKDGRPHTGPFVETDGTATDADNNKLPPLKDRPHNPDIVDGKKIPESNDGVMFDKNRERPQKGTTGMEGGVSAKAKARMAQEGQTGEKALAQPESPKERLPLPQSESRRILPDEEKEKDKLKQSTDRDRSNTKLYAAGGDDYTGLDKPNLPDVPRDRQNPLPKSAVKDHLSTTQPPILDSTRASKQPGKGDDGISQPLHSFVLSLTMILVSEVGDKTFLVAALMAMKHDRLVVFSAAYGALLVMTVLSAVLGHAVPTLISKRLTSLLAAVLFLGFGAKLLREGMNMDPDEGVSAEMHEVEQELAEKEKEQDSRSLEMGIKTSRSSRSKGRFPTPVRSPSQSPSRSPQRGSNALGDVLHGIGNLCSLLLSPAWVQTFVMTFLGEWGDRSQIATIAMAAGQDYWWVTLGAMCGHAVCTGVAVVGGRAIAGRVSLRVVTVGGAVAFLIFAFIYFFEALHG